MYTYVPTQFSKFISSMVSTFLDKKLIHLSSLARFSQAFSGYWFDTFSSWLDPSFAFKPMIHLGTFKTHHGSLPLFLCVFVCAYIHVRKIS